MTRSSKSLDPDSALVPIDGAQNVGDRMFDCCPENDWREESTTVTNRGDTAQAQVQTASATDKNNDKAIIQNINIAGKTVTLSSLQELIKIGDIAKLQNEEESLKKCYEWLKDAKGGYFESQGILYKHYTINTNAHTRTYDNNNTKDALLVVPLLLRIHLVLMAHQQGHFGSSKTYKKIESFCFIGQE